MCESFRRGQSLSFKAMHLPDGTYGEVSHIPKDLQTHQPLIRSLSLMMLHVLHFLQSLVSGRRASGCTRQSVLPMMSSLSSDFYPFIRVRHDLEPPGKLQRRRM